MNSANSRDVKSSAYAGIKRNKYMGVYIQINQRVSVLVVCVDLPHHVHVILAPSSPTRVYHTPTLTMKHGDTPGTGKGAGNSSGGERTPSVARCGLCVGFVGCVYAVDLLVVFYGAPAGLLRDRLDQSIFLFFGAPLEFPATFLRPGGTLGA